MSWFVGARVLSTRSSLRHVALRFRRARRHPERHLEIDIDRYTTHRLIAALRSLHCRVFSAVQSMLRRRRGDEPLGPSPASTVAPEPAALAAGGAGSGALAGDAASPRAEGSCAFEVQASASRHAGSGTGGTGGDGGGDGGGGYAGGDAGLGEQDPRVARLVRKLASKKWVLLYDSLKATFTLQAEGIAREVVLEATTAAAADAASAACAARDNAFGEGSVEGGGGGQQRRALGAAGLERLRRCLVAWEAYKDWCEEVSACVGGGWGTEAGDGSLC